MHRPLPVPPEALRQGPLRHGAFTSPLHNRYNAAWLGYALGWSFLVCFLTGLISHAVQQPPSWFFLPSSPTWLYRATQGTHVATGIACVPLLLAKLWTVYPMFWEWPPVRSIAHGLERLSLLGLVGGSLFQLLTGVANLYQWYFFQFFFTPTHYFTSWIVMGSLLIHIGTKIVLARDVLSAPPEQDDRPRAKSTALTLPYAVPPPAVRAAPTVRPVDPEPGRVVRALGLAPGPVWFGSQPQPADDRPGRQPGPTHPAEAQDGDDVAEAAQPPDDLMPPGMSRRWFITTVGLAAGAVTVATVGQIVPALRGISVLAPRVQGGGGQRVPVNKTAAAAGIALDAAAYRLLVTGNVPRPYEIDLGELEALSRHDERLPLTCVEGWSVGADWRGVRLSDLLARAGAPRRSAVRIESMEQTGLYRSSVVPERLAASPLALLATHLDGERLDADHGYPLRLIAPNRPGVQQTKWIREVVVL